ncbi:MAG: lipopolysaccharide heptosyltransferase II [Persephonella sp.]|nr:MAG: lipopolysaccharide heptosyltransferase II [Persephonella sp.]
MKFLIWQTAFLGDLILTTPLIHSLKNMYPNSTIDIITKPFGLSVLKNNPYINKVIIYDKKKHSNIELIKKLRKGKYDIAISPHRSHRASYSLFLSGIRKRIGFDKAGFSFLYTDKVRHRFDGTHEIDRNLKLLTKLRNYDGTKLFKFPELFLTKEEDKFYQKYNLEDKGYILVAPGSKWKTKRWTDRGFSKVINYFLEENEKVVLIGSDEDKEFTYRILSSIKKDKSLLNLVGETSLRESFSLIKHGKVLISNDSAPVHMAVAFNTPVVDIYGPTVKEFGFFPYRNGIVVEVEGLKCRPCGLHGHNSCPIKTYECMEKITSNMVIEAVYKILGNEQ